MLTDPSNFLSKFPVQVDKEEEVNKEERGANEGGYKSYAMFMSGDTAINFSDYLLIMEGGKWEVGS